MSPTIDDDDIKAAANRLRHSGWLDTGSDEQPARRKRRPIAPPPVRFGGIEASVKFAAQEMAKERDDYTSWPLISEIAQAYGFGFDDAFRALAEAKRLAGETA
jgi:hypothetical protein